MTRKKAIEIVVANVKMGWVPKKWAQARILKHGMAFWYAAQLKIPADFNPPPPKKYGAGWVISRKWLEEKGYL
jgi:hypothetical protein